jgi:hypothetical protein
MEYLKKIAASRLARYVLGNGRLTTALGFIIALPGVYDGLQAIVTGLPVNLRTFIASLAMALFARFTAQEQKVTAEPKVVA